MHSPIASVLIVTRNGAQSLPRTLDSLRAQTFSDFELILIDDGSTDRTWDFITALDWQRLRAHRNTRSRGEVAALNQALEWAGGRYVTCHAAGDVSAPDRFEKQVALLDRREDLVGAGASLDWVDEEGRTLHHIAVPTGYRMLADWVKEEEPWVLALAYRTLMLRREALGKANGYRVALGEAASLDLWLRLAEPGRFASLPETLCSVAFHPSMPVISRHAELCAYAGLARGLAGERAEKGAEQGELGEAVSPLEARSIQASFFARRAGRAGSYLHWAEQFEAWGGPAAEYVRSLWWRSLAAWPFSQRLWQFIARRLRGEAPPAEEVPAPEDDDEAD